MHITMKKGNGIALQNRISIQILAPNPRVKNVKKRQSIQCDSITMGTKHKSRLSKGIRKEEDMISIIFLIILDGLMYRVKICIHEIDLVIELIKQSYIIYQQQVLKMDTEIEESFNKQYEQLNRSYDNEVNFLKKKILEIHHKLLKQLQLNKQLEDNYIQITKKNELLIQQNQNLNIRINQNNINRQKNQKNTHQQKKIIELQNKNQLLRIDLQSMRNRILGEIMQKNNLQQKFKETKDKLTQIQQKYNILVMDVKKKQIQNSANQNLINILKNKIQMNGQINKKLALQIQQYKKNQSNFNKKIQQYQTINKNQKQKYQNLLQQYKNFQIQLKNARQKLDKSQKIIQQYKNKQYIDNRQKTYTNHNNQLQKLTQQMNQMNIKFKQKQRQLQKSKSKPYLQNIKRQNQFNDVKILVQKLQNEQKQKVNHRKHAIEKSPLKNKQILTYQNDKKDYLSRLNEIGVLENNLLQINIGKNKIMNELDKIDQTKVKTQQLINRRRKLQQQLKKTESMGFEIKSKLKNLNII